MGMIDKGVPEICLFQSIGIKTFLSNCDMHRIVKHADPQSTVYEGCSISLQPKVEADVLYTIVIWHVCRSTQLMKIPKV